MDMDRGTFEQQLLAHAERQTKTLQTLQNYALAWTIVAVIALAGALSLIYS